jgi:hypothetical protein
MGVLVGTRPRFSSPIIDGEEQNEFATRAKKAAHRAEALIGIGDVLKAMAGNYSVKCPLRQIGEGWESLDAISGGFGACSRVDLDADFLGAAQGRKQVAPSAAKFEHVMAFADIGRKEPAIVNCPLNPCGLLPGKVPFARRGVGVMGGGMS